MSTLPEHTARSAAERERLLIELEQYGRAWHYEIAKRVAAYNAEHTRPANAVMVPSGFHDVAHGFEIDGLHVITPMFSLDYAIELPHVCFIAPTNDHPTIARWGNREPKDIE